MGCIKRHSARKKLDELVQRVERTILKTVRKGDVVTRWDENKYVIVAVDNGYEKSTITSRLIKNIQNEIANDLLSVTLLFGAASYPIEGKLLKICLERHKINCIIIETCKVMNETLI